MFDRVKVFLDLIDEGCNEASLLIHLFRYDCNAINTSLVLRYSFAPAVYDLHDKFEKKSFSPITILNQVLWMRLIHICPGNTFTRNQFNVDVVMYTS